MKKLKILILIFVVIVILILGVLLFFINNNNNNTSKGRVLTPEDKVGYKIDPVDNSEKDIDIKENFKNIENVSDNITYYTVKAIADKYIMAVASDDKEILKGIIAPSYIKKYNITDNNILKIANIPKISRDFHVTYITELKKIQINSNVQAFIITGKGRTFDAKEKFQFSLILQLDTSEKLYYVYPEQFLKDNGYNTLKYNDKIKDLKLDEVKSTKNNFYTYVSEKNDKEMSIEYMYNFKDLLIYYKDDAYEKLDSEYREKRFKSKEDFYNYIDENKIMIALMSSEKFKTVINDDTKDYLCSDQYNNIYKIRHNKKNGIMDYTVFLDNYTIPSKEDEKTYKEAKIHEKAKINLNKFVSMLNTKDYNAIYEHLDNTFKKNSLKNINELQKLIKNNCYEINEVQIKNVEEKDNYYAFTCNLINQRNSNESKQVSIIISKTDDTNFKMSFSF